ncbi:MAG: hypothetical protein R6T83_05935 [Salinibacter sp.]
MRTVHARRLSSVWRQALVLVLALGVGLQGVPVQSLVQAVAPSTCVCAEKGYCPRNPDGDCACSQHGHGHHGSESHASAGHASSSHVSTDASSKSSAPDGSQLVLRSCDTTGPDARAGLTATKWLLPRVEHVLTPPVVETERVATDGVRASQREGHDIFRPPGTRSA